MFGFRLRAPRLKSKPSKSRRSLWWAPASGIHRPRVMVTGTVRQLARLFDLGLQLELELGLGLEFRVRFRVRVRVRVRRILNVFRGCDEG